MILEKNIETSTVIGKPKKEKSIFLDVFLATIIDDCRQLYEKTILQLVQYLKHFWLCIIFLWSPSLQGRSFAAFDFRKFCRQSFELVTIASLLLIFLESLGMINPPMKLESLDLSYGDSFFAGNSFVSTILQYVITAISYFFMALVTILTGRAFRKWLFPKFTVRQMDMLLLVFFNAYFCIAVVVGFVVRICLPPDVDYFNFYGAILLLLFLLVVVLTSVWSVRFVLLNGKLSWRSIPFFIFTLLFYTPVYILGSLLASGFLVN
jgi:hypothetical protein